MIDLFESNVLTFNPHCSYDIGILRPGMTEDMPNAQLQTTGRYPAQTLLGSQLIEHGVRNVEELFKINPFKLAERKSYTIFEVDPMTKERRFFGKGSVLPKAVSVPVEESLADDSDTENDKVIPLFEPDNRREDPVLKAERQTISVLHDELMARDQAMERSHRITEQALLQTDRILSQLTETVTTLKESFQSKEELAMKLASMEAQVDAILKIREFEESVRTKQEAERDKWREKERELERASEQKQGLGDLMESMAPYAPIIQMILERILPTSPNTGGMPGAMPGMPPGAIPGMMPGGMQSMPPGMPGMMPNSAQRMSRPAQQRGMPQQPRPAAGPQDSKQVQSDAPGGEGQQNKNVF